MAVTTTTTTTQGPQSHQVKLLFLLLIITTTTTMTDADHVLRQNIGLIYEQLPGQLITGHDNHQIILAVPYFIPQNPWPKPPIYNTIKTLQLPSLGPRDNHDTRILQQAADLDQLIANIDHNIDITMHNIQHFLSDPINNRPKRAILVFLGEALQICLRPSNH